MADNISTGTRSILYFNDFKQNVGGDSWFYIYMFVLALGAALFGTFIYQINLYTTEKKYDEVNGRVWYLVANIIVAFFIYGFTRRRLNRTISPGFSESDYWANWNAINSGKGLYAYSWMLLFLLPFSPAFVFVELWDKFYLVFRKIFKGDQEEFDQEKLDSLNNKLSSKLHFLKTVDLDRSERFTYLFGNFSYDRGDNASIFKEGTDIVRTPVLICSFFVALCMLIPVAITTANGESLDKSWEKNIAPVSAILSGLVLIFVLGTVQGYGDRVSVNRESKNNKALSKRSF